MRKLTIVAMVVASSAAGLNCLPDHRFDDWSRPGSDAIVPDGIAPRALVPVPSGVSIQGDHGPAGQVPASFDSQPVHQVFTSGYEISATCVDQTYYDECVAAGPCAASDVTQVTREMAAAFCTWIDARLPTEAELERAVRGDDGTSTLHTFSPYGLTSCGFGTQGVWTADNYRCDAYVDRAWANPLEIAGAAHYRRFAGVITARSQVADERGIRCARTLETTAPPRPPAQPTCSGACTITDLALGDRFGCALRGNGSVWCWGDNTHGELGVGDTLDAMPATTARPVVFSGAAAVEIAAGTTFACARTASGVVACWGDNARGQLGGSQLPLSRTIVVVAQDATAVSAAGDHGCAIVAGGSVVCWGRGSAEQTGSGPTSVTPTGIVGASVIASGPQSDCALAGTTVSCWGLVHDAAGTLTFHAPSAPRTFALAASALAVGRAHACAVVTTEVQCWGDRAAWGGTGIATSPETVGGTLVAPAVFAADAGTVILDQGTVELAVNVRMPTGLAIDGNAVAFSGAGGDGCATTAGGVTCFGVERGQLGRSNGCDAAPATSALVVP